MLVYLERMQVVCRIMYVLLLNLYLWYIVLNIWGYDTFVCCLFCVAVFVKRLNDYWFYDTFAIYFLDDSISYYWYLRLKVAIVSFIISVCWYRVYTSVFIILAIIRSLDAVLGV